jgi:hypothetical protein
LHKKLKFKLKMKKLKLLTIIFLFSMFFMSNNSYSQIKYCFAFEYSTAFNAAQAADYISDPSWGGFSTSYKAITNKKLTYGIELGWNIFSQTTTGTTQIQNGAISGYQARYYNYVPILANVGYAFQNKRQSKITPYAQVNVGTFYITQQFQAGVTTITDEGWNFGFGPEVGLIYNAGSNVGITFNAKYNYALSNGGTTFNSGSSSKTVGDIDYSFFNINLGIGYIQ